MWRKRLECLMQLCCMAILGLSMSACKKAPPTDGATAMGGADVATAIPAKTPTVAKGAVAPAPVSQDDGAGGATEPSPGPGTSGTPGDPPMALKDRIVGKWVNTVSNSTMAGNVTNTIAVKLTYEFTLDGKQLITTEISNSNPGLPKPPTIPRTTNSYKVVNDQEIEVTTPKFATRFAVTIIGDEMSMANVKDKQGKLITYKKVK
jgi:hypothetical protein